MDMTRNTTISTTKPTKKVTLMSRLETPKRTHRKRVRRRLRLERSPRPARVRCRSGGHPGRPSRRKSSPNHPGRSRRRIRRDEEGGICTSEHHRSPSWPCSCSSGYWCSSKCNTRFSAHQCRAVTATPTKVPTTKVATKVPTKAPTLYTTSRPCDGSSYGSHAAASSSPEVEHGPDVTRHSLHRSPPPFATPLLSASRSASSATADTTFQQQHRQQLDF
jgi:hypothetical protein